MNLNLINHNSTQRCAKGACDAGSSRIPLRRCSASHTSHGRCSTRTKGTPDPPESRETRSAFVDRYNPRWHGRARLPFGVAQTACSRYDVRERDANFQVTPIPPLRPSLLARGQNGLTRRFAAWRHAFVRTCARPSSACSNLRAPTFVKPKTKQPNFGPLPVRRTSIRPLARPLCRSCSGLCEQRCDGRQSCKRA